MYMFGISGFLLICDMLRGLELDKYQVYVVVDGENRIISVNSSAFLPDAAGWVQIDEGTGDRYHHAQGNYFPKSKFDERGIPRYAYVPDGNPKWRERTSEEMDADYVPPEPVTPLEDRVGAVEIKTGDLEEALDMILSGVTE